jgi:hypothetical protein
MKISAEKTLENLKHQAECGNHFAAAALEGVRTLAANGKNWIDCVYRQQARAAYAAWSDGDARDPSADEVAAFLATKSETGAKCASCGQRLNPEVGS